MNRPTRSRLYERRREVANSALKGWTQAAIARQMHIPPATVSRDLAAMREFWREFPVYEVNVAVRLLRKKADFAQRAVLWSNQPYPALHQRLRQFSNGKTDRAVFGEPAECCDSSAGPGWGTGEDTSPAVSSSSVEKLRKSAMSGS